jgi:hypothetical protein
MEPRGVQGTATAEATLSSMLDVNAAKEKNTAQPQRDEQSHRRGQRRWLRRGQRSGEHGGLHQAVRAQQTAASVRASADSGESSEVETLVSVGLYAAVGEKIAQPLAPFVRLHPQDAHLH